MSQGQDVKIRVLPRACEKPLAAPLVKRQSRWLIYLGSSACLILAALIFIAENRAPAQKPLKKSVQGKVDLSSVPDPVNSAVSKHLNDSLLREKMMAQQAAIANQAARRAGTNISESSAWSPDNQRTYGVQLDQEDVVGQIYRELNDHGGYSNSVEDQINGRLANRKWLNELDRAEKINYIRNFLRSAYEKGYEVQLDQNLVVVGVRRLQQNQKVNIDQVVNKMAQGF